MQLKKLYLAAAALIACSASSAQVSISPEAVLQKLKTTFVNTPFTEVRATPISGIYEVLMGKDIAYTDATGRYFMFGNVMDMQTQRNLTQERRSEINKVDVSTLKLGDAIKTVKGDGKRVLYVFSDPECGYCKRLEPTLQQLNNVTIYTFLFPILGEKSNKSAKSVWCAADRNKAWGDYMLRSGPLLQAECETPIQRNVALGTSLGITGTPTLISGSGRMQPGAIPLEKIEELLAETGAAAKTAKAN
jgi:thiol:disulfide interchange protein DsbC